MSAPRLFPFWSVLLAYAVVAFTYYSFCGLLGRTYHPLAAFQVYSMACAAAFGVSLWAGRKTGLWEWRRLWPATPQELLASFASVIILTCSTLAMLMPGSFVAAIVMKAGPLALVAHSPILPAVAAAAVMVACWGKPVAVALPPLLLAVGYIVGYALKLRATRDKSEEPADFLAAEMLLTSVFGLVVGGMFGQAIPSAPVSDWRLWAIGAASLGMGLLSTQLMLRAEPRSLSFPAYRCTGLIAALGATWARGESLGWTGWTAAALALVVVVAASRRRGG